MPIPPRIQSGFNRRFVTARSLPQQLLLGLLAGVVLYFFAWLLSVRLGWTSSRFKHAVVFPTIVVASMIVLPLCLRIERINNVAARCAAFIVMMLVVAIALTIVVVVVS